MIHSSIFGRALAVGLAAIALAGSAAAQQGEPVKIGTAMATKSGFGEQGLRGMQFAVKQVNAAGGIWGGRPVELVLYDDQNKPEEGVAAYERLINRDKVTLLAGSLSSSVAGAELPMTRRYKRAHIVSFVKADNLREAGHPMAFFLNTTVKMDVAQFHAFLAKDLKLKRVAVLADLVDFGEAGIANVKRDWSAPGSPELVAIERFDLKDTDFSPVLTRIKGLKPDAVYVMATTAEAFATIVRQMDQLLVPGLRLAAPGTVSESFLKLAGKSAEGVLVGDFYSSDQSNAENVAFVQGFEAEYKYRPEKMELIGYETIRIATDALNKAGPGGSQEAIAAALRETQWKTPRGSWKFERMGQSWQAPGGFVLLTVKDGKIVRYKQ